MTEFIIGSTSRIARAYVETNPNQDFVFFDRSQYLPWANSREALQAAFADAQPSDTIHIFAAITDPKAAAEAIDAVNVKLPEAMYGEAVNVGCTVVTYGTVMEITPGVDNSYVSSKRRLVELQSEFIKTQSFTLKHFRLHTVYGMDRPQPHMFLGQILKALESNTEFLMSSGRQLREYQHAHWVAEQARLSLGNPTSEIVEFTTGTKLSLAELATGIFDYFGKSHLLKIGALPDPVFEAYPDDRAANVGGASDGVLSVINQVSGYLKSCLLP